MDKTFKPREIEDRWNRAWEERGYYAPAKDAPPAGAESYSIAIPPPNVTGRLHMGHGFQLAIMDALIRHQRMRGRDTLWQVGTDHAGIATQMVVERQLNAEGAGREAIGREAFVERVWQWKEEYGGIITGQLRRLGSSLDWSRERFTMDAELSALVERVFIELYRQGLIYRGLRLVNWDPKLLTAISDLEVISEEEDGSLWHLRYPVVDGDGAGHAGHVTVATTRPETLLGDTAVAVHPNDDRYRHLIGKMVELPLCDRRIPIIADDYVDPEFGSGCVKITPAHDFNDYEMGLRHGLPMINILNRDASIGDAAPAAYRGLDRFAARERVVADFERAGLLAGIDPHKLKVPRGDRSGVVVEPFLTKQWYVAIDELAKPAIKAVEDGEIEFVPRNWENTYFAWMRDIQDWCISRQLWWGHRIPAWYDEQDNVYVGAGEAEVRREHGLPDDLKLRQDADVLDTWFSSALWTFSTLGWKPEQDGPQSEYFKRFHPTSVLVTGFDIIFFWVARMIMMTLRFTGEIPFRQVYITGLVRDEHGQKMSKSKGNILDPIDLIDGISLPELIAKRTDGLMQPHLRGEIERATRQSFPAGIPGYGADALRFTFYSLASTGRDIKFDIGRMAGFRNFCNKIWNAARYTLMNCEGKPVAAEIDPSTRSLSVADRWIDGRLQATIAEVHGALAEYRFDKASRSLYEFFWNEFCDWYVELSKPLLWNEEQDPAAAAATRRVLLETLECSLRLLHPFMPFISEEVWQRVAPLLAIDGDSIMLQPYPEAGGRGADPAGDGDCDQEAAADIDWLKQIVTAVRAIRGEMDVPPARRVPLLLRCRRPGGEAAGRARLEKHRPYLIQLAKLESIEWLEGEAPPAAASIGAETEVLVPLAGLIDVEAELARLDREIAKLEKGLHPVRAKLGNPRFTANAPEKVVAEVREREAELSARIAGLREKRAALAEV